jgi:hypothetical protein
LFHGQKKIAADASGRNFLPQGKLNFDGRAIYPRSALTCGLAPEVAGVPEHFDFGCDADHEDDAGDHGDHKAREALREFDVRSSGLGEKATGSRRICGWGGLVNRYGNPTTLTGPHKVEVLLRSSHFFLLFFLLCS